MHCSTVIHRLSSTEACADVCVCGSVSTESLSVDVCLGLSAICLSATVWACLQRSVRRNWMLRSAVYLIQGSCLVEESHCDLYRGFLDVRNKNVSRTSPGTE